MLRNFFKTAARNILKYKTYSIINFIGLTCGLALSLLIVSYIRSELSFDTFHQKADRLYRLAYTAPNGLKLATTPPPIAPVMKDFFPEVEAAARVYGRNVSISKNGGNESFEESNVYFADSSIMNTFSFQFVKGNPAKALTEPYTVLINEEMAAKYFGDQNPIGESLIFGGKHSFKVIGVVKDFPENSHLRFNMIVPYESMYHLENDQAAQAMRNNLAVNFIISHSYTYVLLKPGADPQRVNTNMDAFLKKYAQPNFLVGQVFELMPVTDIHLKSTLLAEPSSTSSMTTIYIFGGVGILTLIIACINYINLSTAQSFTRIKEIGIRKILGSLKYQLIIQFLAESFLFCFVAFALSFVVFYITLPLLNQVTGKQLLFSYVTDGLLLSIAFVLLIVITLLAGGYPAYFITQFESVHALKGEKANYGSQLLRRVLVVFQLTIACTLLIGSIMIMKQLRYLNNFPLGFQKDHVIVIPLFSQNLNGIFAGKDSAYATRLQTFRDVVEGQTGVKGTALSSATPGLGATYRGTIPEGFTREDNLFIANMSIDYDFLQTYGMSIIAGRSFSKEYSTDQATAFIVNESAIKEFHWDTPEKALGKTINREGKEGKVVGVVKDFHFTSLATPISSMVMEVSPNQFNMLSIKFENTNVQQTIDKLRGQWNAIFPEKTFEFNFLDEQLDQQYQDHQNFARIIQSFTGIAILISCLGVYGLVLFVVQRKFKEIGVRKVLGASVTGILTLIYRDFAWLLLAGFLLAVPVSYYLLNQWLDNFIYHASIDVLTYILSFILVFIVVTATISYQALKASLMNPVRSLRVE
ncbi:ABC transporter permease [Ohtaekwangia koreensis]|uniref:Putative ABC transport system permease protein n=1 Tax=Ohtaekwangia koreensis TaxID=688867 RepID=A0A1T5KSF8_9BACT|nr:ABC transporter permease [Ohtaekwangia koreensis]SKC66714.1 putative ABC transport system permease protein [Ohtaekwangia koreensis]